MADYTTFPATLVTPEGEAFSGDVQEISVSSTAGGLGILARRSPVVADLAIGTVRVRLADGTQRTWATAEGFAQASDSIATVIVEDAVELDRIDDARIEAIRSTAQERLDAAERGEEVPEGQLSEARRSLEWSRHLESVRDQA